MATNVVQLMARHSEAFAAVEVTPQPAVKRTGSFVASSRDGSLVLLKSGYGSGSIRDTSSHALMSTNTWWVLLDRFRERLNGGIRKGESLDKLLRDAAGDTAHARTRAEKLFDDMFPVRPYLSLKQIGDRRLIQVERDLDQLSLLGQGTVVPMQVNSSRTNSVKATAAMDAWWRNRN